MLIKTTGWIAKPTGWYSDNQLKQFLIDCFLDFYICDSVLNFIIPSKFAKIFYKQFSPLLFKVIYSNWWKRAKHNLSWKSKSQVKNVQDQARSV